MALSNNIKARHSFVQAIRPAATRTAATVTGIALDRGASSAEIADDMLVYFETGAITGTPDSMTVTVKLQHSEDDGSTDAYADVTDLNIVEAATKTITAANSTATLAVNTNGLKRYVKVIMTIAFVNGSTPSVFTNALFILGKRRYD